MLLGIKTDTPTAEFYLYDTSGSLLGQASWLADRQLAHDVLRRLEEFLKEHAAGLESLSGLFVFQGPGSFTGLRIGATVMNTLAYSYGLPIVGTSGDIWQAVAVDRLLEGHDDRIVLPEYGAPARITAPKK